VVLASLAVASCDGGSNGAAPTTTGPPTTTATSRAASDGVLRLGVLLPKTGVGSQLGAGMLSAVQLARERVNDAGGVLGRDVVLVEVDEGDDETTAAGAIDRLLRAGVDAIVGPASSLVALADLDAPVDEGVVTCSPTATALALDEYPDDGLFFRTVPSDSLQARAMAQVAEGTGAATVAIGHLDDPYGRGLAETLQEAVTASGLALTTVLSFDGRDDELADEAQRLLADDPGVVVVLGDADDGSRLVGALGQQIGDDRPPVIVVNDALRNPASQPVMRSLPDDVRDEVVGVAPKATFGDAEFAAPYAAHAYDCVMLIALAAIQAGSDDPERIAPELPVVSSGGSTCGSFEDCVAALAVPLQIDYVGATGDLDLSSRTGDPISGTFERFGFNREGLDDDPEDVIEVRVD
jgi:branched-chain amino acid transport system substrate-binding protein